MQFDSMLVYCTVYDMCVCGGPKSIFFQGAPNPLATALHIAYTFIKKKHKAYIYIYMYIYIYINTPEKRTGVLAPFDVFVHTLHPELHPAVTARDAHEVITARKARSE